MTSMEGTSNSFPYTPQSLLRGPCAFGVQGVRRPLPTYGVKYPVVSQPLFPKCYSYRDFSILCFYAPSDRRASLTFSIRNLHAGRKSARVGFRAYSYIRRVLQTTRSRRGLRTWPQPVQSVSFQKKPCCYDRKPPMKESNDRI